MRTLGLAGAVLLLSACAGPKPVVVNQDLRPPDNPGDPYRLTVTVRNRSRGEGEAAVVARLRRRGAEETAAAADGEVNLRPHETTSVTLELTPNGPGPFVPETEVKYPPD